MNKTMIAILAILTIGLAGCTISTGSGDSSGADELSPAEGSVSIDSGLWSEGNEESNDGDEDYALEDDEDEPEDAADDAEEDAVDAEEDDDAIDAGCGFPIHHIEIGESDLAFEIDQPAPEIEITVTGGSGNFNLYPSVTDATLPSGMYFEDGETGGVIAGTPHEEGAFDVTIKVKDIICEETVTEQFTITVFAPFEPPSVIFEPTETGYPEVLARKEPIVAVRVDGDFTNGDGIVFLKNNEIVDIKTLRGFIPLTFEVSESLDQELEDVEGRYTIDVYRMYPDPFLPTIPHMVMPNFTTFPVFPTSLMIMPVLHRIVVTDTWRGDAQYVYYLNVKTQCQTARLKDMHIKFKGTYYERTNKGYCNKSSNSIATRAGFGLTTKTKNFKKGDEDFRSGVFTKEYDLTSEGKNGTHENVIKNPVKVIYWDRDNISYEPSCLEDITRAGLYLNDDHCAGEPKLHVKAIEVKACEKESDLDRDEALKGKCFFASFRDNGDKVFGLHMPGNGDYDVKHHALDKHDGKVWSEERDTKVADIFEDLGYDN